MRWILCLIGMTVVFSAVDGPAPNAAASDPSARSAEANQDNKAREQYLRKKLADLKAEWQRRVDSVRRASRGNGKQRYSEVATLTASLIDERVNDDEREERDLIDAVLLPKEESVFLDHLIWNLAGRGRREGLVKLLSKRCPERLGLHSGVEDVLIIIGREKLTDGTLVLCDAFDQSTDKAAQQEIADALRRGFQFAGITSADNRQVVKQCRAWYVKNKDDYEPNLEYLHHWTSWEFPYEREGVLMRKGSKPPYAEPSESGLPPPGGPQPEIPDLDEIFGEEGPPGAPEKPLSGEDKRALEELFGKEGTPPDGDEGADDAQR